MSVVAFSYEKYRSATVQGPRQILEVFENFSVLFAVLGFLGFLRPLGNRNSRTFFQPADTSFSKFWTRDPAEEIFHF